MDVRLYAPPNEQRSTLPKGTKSSERAENVVCWYLQTALLGQLTKQTKQVTQTL